MENSVIAVSDILFLCGAVVTIWGAVKVYKEIVAPHNQRKKELEIQKQYLERDNERIKKLEESQTMIYECLLVMLNHQITGNGVEKMKEVRNQMQEYLIKH